MLPAGSEQNLTKLIKGKIKGEARKCITGEQYNNVESIISNLKRVYSLNKYVYQLQGKLRNIYNLCQICGRRGHTAPTCRQLNQVNRKF